MASSTLSGQDSGASARIEDLVQEVEQLRAEKEQLQRAVTSHAVVDQAIGVLVLMGTISPYDGFSVLREVSQHTNTKLSSIAEQIVKHAQGGALPETVLTELRAALARLRSTETANDRPGPRCARNSATHNDALLRQAR
ncbi:ANTAR domain-containing protein [Streptomyces sp. NPDC051105]|uniref:ANTAR domain-containing protein n=1 Tax=Streptomyces sp. NPDC051105 TaxID=3154843 RepID=UPI003447EE14